MAAGAGDRYFHGSRRRGRDQPEGMRADIYVRDRLLDLRHVTAYAIVPGTADFVMHVRFGGWRAVRSVSPGRGISRDSTLAGFTRPALFSVPWTSWQLKQTTPREYIWLVTKSLPCIRFCAPCRRRNT